MRRGGTWSNVVVVAILAAPVRLVAQVDADVAAALAAVRARAEAGDAVAAFSLGSLLYFGSTEGPQALDWIRRSAAAGHAPAEFQLGQLYEYGFLVPQDYGRAVEWYRRAADRGDARSQRALGELHLKGRGVATDPTEASHWYTLAAEGDDLRAQVQLGQLYFEGTGLSRQYGSAYVWFTIAAAQTPLLDNRKGILELRNIAAARMTDAEIARAEARVAAWRPRP